MKIGVLFSGQGSQSVGMGQTFYETFSYLKPMVDEASQALGYDLTEILFKENDLINQTLYTQPAILVISLIIYEALKRELNIEPSMMAGFSLGEYSALSASGVFDFAQIVSLIKERARLMEEASQEKPGMMAAVIGYERSLLEAACREISTPEDFVAIANYNCPGQLVVSGTKEKVVELGEALAGKARRFITLNVSGGFHTPLMHSASVAMGELVKQTPFHSPDYPVIMNATAKPLVIEQLRELMEQQIESPVYFEDSIRYMIEQGVDRFIEIGPGKVLSGFVRKIDRSIPVVAVNTVDDLALVKNLCESGE